MDKTKLVKCSRVNGRVLRLPGTIARELGIAITSGAYRPGDRLPGEITSSQKLAVSRTAYREGMRILAAKGLVEARPKTGTRVNPTKKWQMLDPDVLAWAFHGQPDPALLRSLIELRTIVETAAAALAAKRRNEAQLDLMRRALVQMADNGSANEEALRAVQDFHAVLLQATANPYFMSLTTGVAAAVAITTRLMLRQGTPALDIVPAHDRLFAAIVDKEPERARDEMAALIGTATHESLPVRAAKAG